MESHELLLLEFKKLYDSVNTEGDNIKKEISALQDKYNDVYLKFIKLHKLMDGVKGGHPNYKSILRCVKRG